MQRILCFHFHFHKECRSASHAESEHTGIKGEPAGCLPDHNDKKCAPSSFFPFSPLWKNNDLLRSAGAGGTGESLPRCGARRGLYLTSSLCIFVCMSACVSVYICIFVYLYVCVCGASRRLTQAAPHKLAILLPVDCPQQLNHPDCLRFCGKGDVDQASS